MALTQPAPFCSSPPAVNQSEIYRMTFTQNRDKKRPEFLSCVGRSSVPAMHGDVGVHYVVGNARSVGRYVDDSVKMQVSMTLSVNC